MNPRKYCVLDTKAFIYKHRNCDKHAQNIRNFKQNNILAQRLGSGYRIFSLTKKLFAICKEKINFLQWSVIWYTKHSLGQALCLD